MQYMQRNESRSDSEQLLEHVASIDRSIRMFADVVVALGNKYLSRGTDGSPGSQN